VTVAALYVETNGVYYGLPDVDPWDEHATRGCTRGRGRSWRIRRAPAELR
jgi:hypothetical protein